MNLPLHKKPLPGTATKAEVCLMFPKTPASVIRRYINESIRKSDGLPEDQRITLKNLTRKHLETFFETFGFPVGYEDFFR